MNSQDHLPALQIGPVHDHLAVEAAGPQQSGIEDLRPIGGGHDDDALARVEAVELGQELIEGLLALVVSAEAGRDPTRLAKRIQLVDEHDAGRLGLRLLEEVAHAGGADADEHLDEIGSAQAEERHLRLAGHRLGQERLARSRRAREENPLRDLAAQPLVALRVLEKIHDLDQLGPRLVDTGDVVERHAGGVFDVDLGSAPADGHQTALRTPHSSNQEAPEAEEDDARHDPRRQQRQPGVLRRAGEPDIRRLELVDELGVIDPGRDEAVEPLTCLPELRDLLFRQERLQPVRGQRALDGLLG